MPSRHSLSLGLSYPLPRCPGQLQAAPGSLCRASRAKPTRLDYYDMSAGTPLFVHPSCSFVAAQAHHQHRQHRRSPHCSRIRAYLSIATPTAATFRLCECLRQRCSRQNDSALSATAPALRGTRASLLERGVRGDCPPFPESLVKIPVSRCRCRDVASATHHGALPTDLSARHRPSTSRCHYTHPLSLQANGVLAASC
jgi:hypothetical protein